jgi:hypothetical protein
MAADYLSIYRNLSHGRVDVAHLHGIAGQERDLQAVA